MSAVEETVVTITDEQVAAINAARDALAIIAGVCAAVAWNAPMREWDKANPQDYARTAAYANVAADALFDVLNIASSHKVAAIPDDVVLNRKPDES